jgi:hypothetical protein
VQTVTAVRISLQFYLKSVFIFSLITVKENFLPVVAAARDMAVVVSSKLVLSVELKVNELEDPVVFPDPDFPTGLNKYFFNSCDNFA